MVYRVYVEKKKQLAHEAKSLLSEIREFLEITSKYVVLFFSV